MSVKTASDVTKIVETEVDRLGLLFAHEPDGKVTAALEQVRRNLGVELTAEFPNGLAAEFADCFIAAIWKRKREIERST